MLLAHLLRWSFLTAPYHSPAAVGCTPIVLVSDFKSTVTALLGIPGLGSHCQLILAITSNKLWKHSAAPKPSCFFFFFSTICYLFLVSLNLAYPGLSCARASFSISATSPIPSSPRQEDLLMPLSFLLHLVRCCSLQAQDLGCSTLEIHAGHWLVSLPQKSSLAVTITTAQGPGRKF